jgi:hypothetical protein
MIFKHRLFTALLGLLFATVLTNQASALYDPGVGRFCSRDPIRLPQIHCYQSFLSTPLRSIDPTGLSQAEPLTGIKVNVDIFLQLDPHTDWHYQGGIIPYKGLGASVNVIFDFPNSILIDNKGCCLCPRGVAIYQKANTIVTYPNRKQINTFDPDGGFPYPYGKYIHPDPKVEDYVYGISYPCDHPNGNSHILATDDPWAAWIDGWDFFYRPELMSYDFSAETCLVCVDVESSVSGIRDGFTTYVYKPGRKLKCVKWGFLIYWDPAKGKYMGRTYGNK